MKRRDADQSERAGGFPLRRERTCQKYEPGWICEMSMRTSALVRSLAPMSRMESLTKNRLRAISTS